MNPCSSTDMAAIPQNNFLLVMPAIGSVTYTKQASTHFRLVLFLSALDMSVGLNQRAKE